MYYQIEKNEITNLLDHWMKLAGVFAPTEKGQFTVFENLMHGDELRINGPHNTRYPPKSLFLPQSERLFTLKNGNLVEPKINNEPRIVFGIRPCDAHALTLLDTVFLTDQYKDPYWQAERERTILVGLGCDEPCASCFCTTVGSGPFETRGLDILFIPLNEKYIIKQVTEKGGSLLTDLRKVPDTIETEIQKLEQKAIDSLPIAFETIDIRKEFYKLFSEAYWQKVSQSCLGCGVCTFLCPTCYCFDIVDEAQRGERVRNWDTCMFRIYSQEASGHNPRPSRLERTRQRLMHKYAYWLDSINEIGCTGCGRCVRYCPVGLDIRDMIRKAQNWEVVE